MTEIFVHYLGVVATIIGMMATVWRVALKPKLDKSEAQAVQTAQWRQVVDSFMDAQKPLNQEVITTARWAIEARAKITQQEKDAAQISDALANIRMMLEQGRKDNSDQHSAMREFVDSKFRSVEENVKEGRREIFVRLDKLRDDLYEPKNKAN